ncbi:MAG: SHOCT domain-containing protein [Alphaproteobacteria bacterium]
MADHAVLTADRSTHRGGWVYLDPEDARSHPDYGVFGWALFLLGVLFIGPMILLWQDVEIFFGPYDRPENTWILLVVDAILLLASWTACRLLGAERKQFYYWFYTTVILTLCSLAIFISLCLFDTREILPFGVSEPTGTGWQGLFAEIPSIVWWGICLRVLAIVFASIYVMQSRRLNVTVAKRVIPLDPFVAHTWAAATNNASIHPTVAETDAGARYPTGEEERKASAAGLTAATAMTAATVATAATVTTTTTARAVTQSVTAVDDAAQTESVREVLTDTRTERTETHVEPHIAAPIVAAAATPVVETAMPVDAPDDRRLRARLKQLDDARAAGLISDAEFEARRLALTGPK